MLRLRDVLDLRTEIEERWNQADLKQAVKSDDFEQLAGQLADVKLGSESVYDRRKRAVRYDIGDGELFKQDIRSYQQMLENHQFEQLYDELTQTAAVIGKCDVSHFLPNGDFASESMKEDAVSHPSARRYINQQVQQEYRELQEKLYEQSMLSGYTYPTKDEVLERENINEADGVPYYAEKQYNPDIDSSEKTDMDSFFERISNVKKYFVPETLQILDENRDFSNYLNQNAQIQDQKQIQQAAMGNFASQFDFSRDVAGTQAVNKESVHAVEKATPDVSKDVSMKEVTPKPSESKSVSKRRPVTWDIPDYEEDDGKKQDEYELF